MLSNPKKISLKFFKDNRGHFIETYNLKKYTKIFKIRFVEDGISYSKKNVIRGFHGDSKTWKIITCVNGKIQIGFFNCNKKSKEYLNNFYYILSSKNGDQVLVPPNFATAYAALTDNVLIQYKQSEYYGKNKQFALYYKNKNLKFKWKIKKPILSERDKDLKNEKINF